MFSGEVVGHILRWRLAVSGLSGPVVAAVIHAGAPGGIGARIVGCVSPARHALAARWRSTPHKFNS